MTEVVYLIGSPSSPRAKIGWSGNVTKRLGEIQRMSPVDLSVLWSIEGGHRLETALHQSFQARRTHGEWFDFSDCEPVKTVSTAAAAIKGKELQPAYGVDDTYLSAEQLYSIATMPPVASRELVGQLRSFSLRWYRRFRDQGLRSLPSDVAGFIIVRAVVVGLWAPENLHLRPVPWVEYQAENDPDLL